MNKLEVKNENYIDVTEKWLKNAKPNSHKVKKQLFFDYQGVRYYVDGKNVVLDYSKQELEMACFLENTFGGEIYMLPRVNIPKGIKTADYLWNGEYWDLKTLSSSAISETRAIDNIIKSSKRQANNFILNITKTSIERKLLLRQIVILYFSSGREWINKIVVVDNYEILKIFSRNKKAVPPPSGVGKASLKDVIHL